MSQDPGKLKEVEIITKRPDNDTNQDGHHIQSVYLTEEQKHNGEQIKNTEKKVQFSKISPDGANQGESTHKEKQKFQGDFNAANQDLENEKKSIFEDDEIKSPYPKLEAVLENNYFQIFVTLMTMYALFGDDVRVITTTKSADIYFDAITISAMITFIIEMVLAMLSKISYTCSFYFWLDLISTVSLILDIQLIAEPLFYSSGNGESAGQLAQAGKASRVGTKAGRVVRLVRLIRIVKLYKATQDAKEKRQEKAKQKYAEKKRKKKLKVHPHLKDEEENKEPEQKPLCPCLGKNKQKKQEEDVDIKKKGKGPGAKEQPVQYVRDPQTKRLSVQKPQSPQTKDKLDEKGGPTIVEQKKEKMKQEAQKESRVSQVLSAKTTKRVIIIVLALLFIMPFFSADYFNDPPSAIDFSMFALNKWATRAGTTNDQLIEIFDLTKKLHVEGNSRMYLVKIQTPFDFLQYEIDGWEEVREDEKDPGVATLDVDKYAENHPTETAIIAKLRDMKEEDLNFLGYLSMREINIFTAFLSLGRTVFVCIVLTCGALYFSKDANNLALEPIERMIAKLTKISRNPISARDEVQIQDNADENETKLIENAIVKISNLLALGFGEAGSKIIGENISQGGDVNPMMEGTKLWAIYGFCDIRNFTDVTEVLQEDIMIFVNNIGEIVHSYTDRYQGAGNKNIGDAFLLVWKIREDKYEMLEDNEIKYKDQKYINILCDMSIISFMRIQAKLNREPKLLTYRTHKALQERMPNYKVRMGFGIHLGWGIEGAIGSEFKIDASYLSPHVNMASRLEAATKQFGVPLLISSSIQEQCTPQMKRYTRYIDRVTLKGSVIPLGLYTIDMVVDDLPPSKQIPEEDLQNPEKVEERKDDLIQKKLELSNQLLFGDAEVQEIVEEDFEMWDAEDEIQGKKDLRLMMENWDEKFQNLFAEGFQMYLKGNWPAARSKFAYIQRCEEYQEDGPTKNLMAVMEQHKYVAPVDWSGYRMLYEK